MTTPDRLDTWSVRIAEWAAPEETTFAAQTARAYAAGGTPRRHLFSSPGRGGGSWAGGVATTVCPSRAAPRDPTRPPGQRTFRTLDVTSADPLSGTRSQAQEVGDRLRGVRWTLHDDGTLTADLAEVPVLHTTSVDATTRLLTGERTERTDVSATTTWMRARLVAGAGRTARLDLVRAATRDMRVVVDCREFTSTSSTAQRLSLALGGQGLSFGSAARVIRDRYPPRHRHVTASCAREPRQAGR
ncbi:hypothetical protein ACWGKW_25485 [Streptomyces sp. NPDC054766]